MSDLLLRKLRKDLLLNMHLPEYDGIDKDVEEETGKECDQVAHEYSNDQLPKLIRRVLEKRRKGRCSQPNLTPNGLQIRMPD